MIAGRRKLGFNLNGNVAINLTKWMTAEASVQRIRSNNPYQDDSFSGVDHTLINLPPTSAYNKIEIGLWREQYNTAGAPAGIDPVPYDVALYDRVEGDVQP